MSPEQQKITIAAACGWTLLDTPELYGDFACYAKDATGQSFPGIPDYLNDLNAMHEAEKVLTVDQLWRMDFELAKLCGVSGGHGSGNLSEWTWHATATQRAEAFLRTIGKWEEAE